MIWLEIFGGILAYLLGTRGTFGYLKRNNQIAIRSYAFMCSHGCWEIHKGQECHPYQVDIMKTQICRTALAFLWFAWVPLIILYKLVTRGW